MKHLLAAGVLLVALSGDAWGASAPAKSPFVGAWTMVLEGTSPLIAVTLIVSESGGTYTVAIKDPPNAGPAPAGAAALTFAASNVVVRGDTLTFHNRVIQDGRVVSEVDYVLRHSGGKLTGTVTAPPLPPPQRKVTATRQ